MKTILPVFIIVVVILVLALTYIRNNREKFILDGPGMINTREEYEDGVKIIADILKNSGAREIYLVCGNNDIPSVIAEYMPFAKIVEPDTVVDICGVSCNLGHGHYEATMHTEWSFYGHGLSGGTWSPEKNNVKSGICRFNVIWGTSVIFIPERAWFVFPRPETYKKSI